MEEAAAAVEEGEVEAEVVAEAVAEVVAEEVAEVVAAAAAAEEVPEEVEAGHGGGYGTLTISPPGTWIIPVIDGTLPMPCTPGAEYLNNATTPGQFLDCNDLGVWQAREYGCPINSVCANSSIINGVPARDARQRDGSGERHPRDHGRPLLQLDRGRLVPGLRPLPRQQRPRVLQPVVGYNPVLNVILDEGNGSLVLMHNNLTLRCLNGVECNVTQYTDAVTNQTSSNLDITLNNPFVVESVDPNVLVTTNSNGTYFVGLNGAFFPNGTNSSALGITDIVCGQGLLCPENGTSVTVTIVGFTNFTLNGTTYINGVLVVNGISYTGFVPSYSVNGGSLIAGANLNLAAGSNFGWTYSGGTATGAVSSNPTFTTVTATGIIGSSNLQATTTEACVSNFASSSLACTNHGALLGDNGAATNFGVALGSATSADNMASPSAPGQRPSTARSCWARAPAVPRPPADCCASEDRPRRFRRSASARLRRRPSRSRST